MKTNGSGLWGNNKTRLWVKIWENALIRPVQRGKSHADSLIRARCRNVETNGESGGGGGVITSRWNNHSLTSRSLVALCLPLKIYVTNDFSFFFLIFDARNVAFGQKLWFYIYNSSSSFVTLRRIERSSSRIIRVQNPSVAQKVVDSYPFRMALAHSTA